MNISPAQETALMLIHKGTKKSLNSNTTFSLTEKGLITRNFTNPYPQELTEKGLELVTRIIGE